jgi:hypothetical protein
MEWAAGDNKLRGHALGGWVDDLSAYLAGEGRR